MKQPKHHVAYGKLSMAVYGRLTQLRKAYRLGNWNLVEEAIQALEDDLAEAELIIYPERHDENEEAV